MKPSDSALKKELESLKKEKDPEIFNNSILKVKLKLSEFIRDNQFNQAESFSRTLLAVLDSVKERDDEEFVISVLHNFPANSKVTFGLLGDAEEINSYILAEKFRLSDFCATESSDYMKLVHWAVDHDRQEIIEMVLSHVVFDLEENHKNSLSLRQTVLKNFVHGLIWDEVISLSCKPEIDSIMRGLADTEDKTSLDSDVIHGLVKAGLHGTLIKLIERSRFRKYDGNIHTPSENTALYNALPAKPTMNELVHMFLYTDKPDLAEHILFDESVDIAEFINSVKDIKQGQRNMFTLENMEPFSACATRERINTPVIRKRVELLFNSLSDNVTEDKQSQYGSPADVMEAMEELMFDPYIFQVCKRFRAQHLENELGM